MLLLTKQVSESEPHYGALLTDPATGNWSQTANLPQSGSTMLNLGGTWYPSVTRLDRVDRALVGPGFELVREVPVIGTPPCLQLVPNRDVFELDLSTGTYTILSNHDETPPEVRLIATGTDPRVVDAWARRGWSVETVPSLTAEERRAIAVAVLAAGRKALDDVHLDVVTVEKDGGWMVDGDRIYPDEEMMDNVTKMQGQLAGHLRKYMKAIGHESITAEDLDFQMGRDLLRDVMGIEFEAGEVPDRFDIDAL